MINSSARSTLQPHTIPPVALIPLSAATIAEALFVYAPEHIYVRAASYHPHRIECVFGEFVYPYAKTNIRHFTREQALVYVTQAAFVLGLAMTRAGAFGHLDADTYRALIVRERILFSRVTLEFPRLQQNEPGMCLALEATDIQRRNRATHVDLQFSFGDGYCRGTAHGVVLES